MFGYSRIPSSNRRIQLFAFGMQPALFDDTRQVAE